MTDSLGILICGQSLAEGGMGRDPVPKAAQALHPDRALMLTGGPVGIQRTQLQLPWVPLRDGKARVTLASALADGLLNLLPQPPAALLISGQAWGGKPYRDLKKQSPSGFGVYEACLRQAAHARQQVPDVRYRGLVLVHGEQDGLLNNADYEQDLVAWLQDFDQDLRTSTGQAEPLRLYLCQTSSASGYGYTGGIQETRFPTPLAQLSAHLRNERIVLIGPKYALPYADYAHLTNLGQCLLGEYYAKALACELQGGRWEPLRPLGFQVDGRFILIDFSVPVGELEWDTSQVPAAPNYGFEYLDGRGQTLVDVEKSGPLQIRLQISGPPAANAQVAYAHCNGESGAAQVSGRGARGNLRDQDNRTSAWTPGYRLYNWCCSFRQALS